MNRGGIVVGDIVGVNRSLAAGKRLASSARHLPEGLVGLASTISLVHSVGIAPSRPRLPGGAFEASLAIPPHDGAIAVASVLPGNHAVRRDGLESDVLPDNVDVGALSHADPDVVALDRIGSDMVALDHAGPDVLPHYGAFRGG